MSRKHKHVLFILERKEANSHCQGMEGWRGKEKWRNEIRGGKYIQQWNTRGKRSLGRFTRKMEAGKPEDQDKERGEMVEESRKQGSKKNEEVKKERGKKNPIWKSRKIMESKKKMELRRKKNLRKNEGMFEKCSQGR